MTTTHVRRSTGGRQRRPLRKSDLSPAWHALIDACEAANWGFVENVQFRDGDPVGTVTWVKTLAFGTLKDNGPSVGAGDPDGVLTESWQDAIALVGSRPHVHVRRLELAHGHPVKLYLEDRVEVGLG